MAEMKDYFVSWFANDKISNLTIKASGTTETEFDLIFLDEHGEDGYTFPLKDIISYEEV